MREELKGALPYLHMNIKEDEIVAKCGKLNNKEQMI